MLGLNQFDAQALLQMQQQQQQQQSNRYNKLQQAQYSFDDQQLSGSYYDGSGMVNPAHANRLNMLQQAQRHSFNMDLLNSTNPGNDYSNQQQQQLELMQHQQQQQQHHQFFTNKRPTGLRNQPISDVSIEELNADFSSLSPQQQQHLLMLRNQQFLNNSNLSGNVEAANPAEAAAAAVAPEPAIDYTKLEPMKPPRRKSLPSIVKKQLKEDETAHSSAELNSNNKYQETYIIENGIKKRVIETHNSAARNTTDADSNGLDDEAGVNKRRIQVNYEDDQTPQLPRKIVIESISDLSGGAGAACTVNKRVSMPSIPAYLSPDLAKKGLHSFHFHLFAIAFILFCCCSRCCSDAAGGGQQAELAEARRDPQES